MSSSDPEAPCLLGRDPDRAARHAEERGRDLRTHAHTSAFVETWPEGDADTFARALARVLVRQVLRDLHDAPSDEDYQPLALAG